MVDRSPTVDVLRSKRRRGSDGSADSDDALSPTMTLEELEATLLNNDETGSDLEKKDPSNDDCYETTTSAKDCPSTVDTDEKRIHRRRRSEGTDS